MSTRDERTRVVGIAKMWERSGGAGNTTDDACGARLVVELAS